MSKKFEFKVDSDDASKVFGELQEGIESDRDDFGNSHKEFCDSISLIIDAQATKIGELQEQVDAIPETSLQADDLTEHMILPLLTDVLACPDYMKVKAFMATFNDFQFDSKYEDVLKKNKVEKTVPIEEPKTEVKNKPKFEF